jgi:hypothetical protein
MFVVCIPILLFCGTSVAFFAVMHALINDEYGYDDDGWRLHLYLMPHILLGSMLVFVLALYCIPLIIPASACFVTYLLL